MLCDKLRSYNKRPTRAYDHLMCFKERKVKLGSLKIVSMMAETRCKI